MLIADVDIFLLQEENQIDDKEKDCFTKTEIREQLHNSLNKVLKMLINYGFDIEQDVEFKAIHALGFCDLEKQGNTNNKLAKSILLKLFELAKIELPKSKHSIAVKHIEETLVERYKNGERSLLNRSILGLQQVFLRHGGSDTIPTSEIRELIKNMKISHSDLDDNPIIQ